MTTKKFTNKLIVFDLNGVLINRVFEGNYKKDSNTIGERIGKHISKHIVSKLENIDFNKIGEYYDIAVWSSMRYYNIEPILDYIFGNYKKKLKFVYTQKECTLIGEKKKGIKPLFMKNVEKITKRYRHYSRKNIIIVDDSNEKIEKNSYGHYIGPNDYKKGQLFDHLLQLCKVKKIWIRITDKN